MAKSLYRLSGKEADVLCASVFKIGFPNDDVNEAWEGVEFAEHEPGRISIEFLSTQQLVNDAANDRLCQYLRDEGIEHKQYSYEREIVVADEHEFITHFLSKTGE